MAVTRGQSSTPIVCLDCQRRFKRKDKSRTYHLSSFPKYFVLLLICFQLVPAGESQELGPFRDCYVNGQSSRCTPQGVDEAQDAPVAANSTCGTPPNTFCRRINFASLLLTEVDCSGVCDAANASLSHPPRYLVDFDLGSPTSWQSENLSIERDVLITLPLGDLYEIELVNIEFDSFKAESLYIEKSEDGGASFVPFHYFSSSCEDTYGIPANTLASVDDEKAPLCTFIENPRPGVLSFLPTSLRPSANDSIAGVSEDVYQFQTATDLRFILDRQYSQEGLPEESYFYAIRTINVVASLQCYGHAEGLIQGEGGGAVCDCMHNTTGDHCELCKDFYQDVPWSRHLGDESFDCKMCNCYNHSQECIFNETVYSQTGEVSGGVCINCSHNTAGRQCQTCVQYYYPDPAKQQSDVDVCIECDCHLPGVRDDGDCIREASQPGSPGDCYCKDFTEGRRCDQCRAGYYNLSTENTQGCQACSCDVEGSFQTDCNQVTGQCMCKENVEGDMCDLCSEGSFNLTSSGCQLCGCVSGASSSMQCDVVTGECPCREGTRGRDCSMVTSGRFFPALDYLTLEAEGDPLADPVLRPTGEGRLFTGQGFAAVQAGSTVNFGNLTVPLSTLYRIVVRYSLFNIDSWRSVQLVICPFGTSVPESQPSCPGINSTISLAYRNWTMGMALAKYQDGCLGSGRSYQFTLEVLESGAMINTSGVQFWIDSLVLIPLEVQSLDVMAGGPPRLYEMCVTARTSLLTRSIEPDECQSLVYSVSTQIYNGTLACNCGIGSADGSCEVYGGQCPCQQSVGGRDCSFCTPSTYGLTSTGCTPCDCHVTGSANDICDSTSGQCTCLQNVVGRQCSECGVGYINLTAGEGCVPCGCDPVGSVNPQCNSSGGCICKEGVTGITCDSCTDQFYNLTVSGCRSCDCSVAGSLGNTCDVATGQCECKTLTSARDCRSCVPNSFNLMATNPLGCQPCYCSGVLAASCEAADNFTAGQVTTLFSVDTMVTWGLLTSTFIPAGLLTQDPLTGRVVYTQGSGTYLFAPDEYLGNRLSSYGQTLSITMGLINTNASLPDSIPPPDTFDIILSGNNDISIGRQFLQIPQSEPTTSSVRIQEDNSWVVIETGSPATATEVLSVLNDLSELLLRIEFDNPEGFNVALYNVSLEVVVPSQMGDVPVMWVEECLCPDNYTGRSCDLCNHGYYRISDGSCQPCDCNGFSDSCDSATGVCSNCSGLTTGDSCEACVEGSFGDPLNGIPCRPCPCPLTTPPGQFTQECEMLGNGSVQCLSCPVGHAGLRCERCEDGFFGDPTGAATGNPTRCSDCQCNGNINTSLPDSCNTTSGECLLCIGNTGGTQCEQCADGYYGDAINAKNCTDCLCNGQGALSFICDQMTGQCDCHANVVGRSCDTCQVDYYGLQSGAGCISCGCHTLGSLSTQCDLVTGDCQCRPLVTGRTCDTCVSGSYGPSSAASGCTSCDCFVNGSVNGECDSEGQCSCVSGFTGLQCDMCEDGYQQTPSGCEVCPNCYLQVYQSINMSQAAAMSLQSSLDGLMASLSSGTFQNRLSHIQGNVSMLTALAGNLTANDSNLQEMINVLEGNLEVLRNRISSAVFNLGQMNNSITAISARNSAILNQINSLQLSLLTAFTTLEEMSVTVIEINNITSSIMDLHVSAQSIAQDISQTTSVVSIQVELLLNITTDIQYTLNRASDTVSLALDKQMNVTADITDLLFCVSLLQERTANLTLLVVSILSRAVDVETRLAGQRENPFSPPSNETIAIVCNSTSALQNDIDNLAIDVRTLNSSLAVYGSILERSIAVVQDLEGSVMDSEPLSNNLSQSANQILSAVLAVQDSTGQLLETAHSILVTLQDFDNLSNQSSQAATDALELVELVQAATEKSVSTTLEVLDLVQTAGSVINSTRSTAKSTETVILEVQQNISLVNITNLLEAVENASNESALLLLEISELTNSIADLHANISRRESSVSAAEVKVEDASSSLQEISNEHALLQQSLQSTINLLLQTPDVNVTLLQKVSEELLILSTALNVSEVNKMSVQLEVALVSQATRTDQLQVELTEIQSNFQILLNLYASLPKSCNEDL